MLITVLSMAASIGVGGAAQGGPLASMDVQLAALEARMPGFAIGSGPGMMFHTGPLVVRANRKSPHFGKSFRFDSKGVATFMMPYEASMDMPTGGIRPRTFSGVVFEKITWTVRGPETLLAGIDPQLPPGGPIVETGDIEIGKDTDDDITVDSGGGTVIIVVDKSVNINCKKCIPERKLPGRGGEAMYLPMTGYEFSDFMLASTAGQRPGGRRTGGGSPAGEVRLRYAGAASRTSAQIEAMIRSFPGLAPGDLTSSEIQNLAKATYQNLQKGMPMTIGLKVTCAKLGWNGKWIIAGQRVQGSQTLSMK